MRKAVDWNPARPIRITPGGYSFGSKANRRAAEELRAAIHAKPDYAEAYYTLGTVLRAERRVPGFREGVAGTIRMQPDIAGAHTTLAAVLRQLGDAKAPQRRAKAGAEIAKRRPANRGHLRDKLRAPPSETGDVQGAIRNSGAAIGPRQTMRPRTFELGSGFDASRANPGAQEGIRKAASLDLD